MVQTLPNEWSHEIPELNGWLWGEFVVERNLGLVHAIRIAEQVVARSVEDGQVGVAVQQDALVEVVSTGIVSIELISHGVCHTASQSG